MVLVSKDMIFNEDHMKFTQTKTKNSKDNVMASIHLLKKELQTTIEIAQTITTKKLIQVLKETTMHSFQALSVKQTQMSYLDLTCKI